MLAPWLCIYIHIRLLVDSHHRHASPFRFTPFSEKIQPFQIAAKCFKYGKALIFQMRFTTNGFFSLSCAGTIGEGFDEDDTTTFHDFTVGQR
jgi:hypothetical protein